MVPGGRNITDISLPLDTKSDAIGFCESFVGDTLLKFINFKSNMQQVNRISFVSHAKTKKNYFLIFNYF